MLGSAVAWWHAAGGVIALPGYTVFITPWAGFKSHTGWGVSRIQSSSALGGGSMRNDGAQNSEIVWDIWLDAGTYKYSQLYNKNTDEGIYHVRLDDVDKGTIDAYAAATSNDNYSEITGVVVTAGLKKFALKMATKNASSSGYWAYIQSCAWIRTGA